MWRGGSAKCGYSRKQADLALGAVSYTHLDVYKRQSFVWAKPFSSQVRISRSVSFAASKLPAALRNTSKAAPVSGVSICVSP